MGRRKRREKLLAEGPQSLELSGLDRKGFGVGEREGRAVRVFGALPGESISYQPTERWREREEGELVEIRRASPDRVEPGCPHFGYCGGCSLQHLGDAARMARAAADLGALLEAEGLRPEAWAPPLVGEAWAYRRRARLGVKRVEAMDRVLVGFRARNKRYVARLDRCPVLAPPVGDLLQPLGELIDATSLASRTAQVEVAVGDDATALVLRVLDAPEASDLERYAAFERSHGVRIFLQTGGLDTVTPLDGGEPLLHYRADDGPPLAFRPTDFVQVHGELNRAMVAQALDWLALPPGGAALDLFCGLGNFTLPLARRGAGALLGLEGDEGLVERGRANAAAAGLGGVRFDVVDLYRDFDPALLNGPRGGGWAGVILDPPRSGAEAVAGALRASVCPRVLYVACGPEALARDAAAMVREGGYRLARVGVMDMFPQTAHYESMALFVAPREAGSMPVWR